MEICLVRSFLPRTLTMHLLRVRVCAGNCFVVDRGRPGRAVGRASGGCRASSTLLLPAAPLRAPVPPSRSLMSSGRSLPSVTRTRRTALPSGSLLGHVPARTLREGSPIRTRVVVRIVRLACASSPNRSAPSRQITSETLARLHVRFLICCGAGASEAASAFVLARHAGCKDASGGTPALVWARRSTRNVGMRRPSRPRMSVEVRVAIVHSHGKDCCACMLMVIEIL